MGGDLDMHLASNFLSRLYDKSLKMLLIREAYIREPRKCEYGMEWFMRISQKEHTLRAIPSEKWVLSHDSFLEGTSNTNFFQIFNSVLERTSNIPITAYI